MRSGDGEESLDARERPEDIGEWFDEVDADCEVPLPCADRSAEDCGADGGGGGGYMAPSIPLGTTT